MPGLMVGFALNAAIFASCSAISLSKLAIPLAAAAGPIEAIGFAHPGPIANLSAICNILSNTFWFNT